MKPDRIARLAAEAYVNHRKRLAPAPFGRRAACFVSYHDSQGDLRGCIGSLSPSQADLADEIVANAIAAAMRDPRFLPLEPEELKNLQVEVSVLGELEAIPDISYLDVKRYGVVVMSGSKRGVLLPDLAGIDQAEQQVAIAKRKAGIGPYEQVALERFEIIKYS